MLYKHAHLFSASKDYATYESNSDCFDFFEFVLFMYFHVLKKCADIYKT